MPKTIKLEGDVGWEITADYLRSQLPEDKSDVILDIYSYGGSVFEGIELYNVIDEYEGGVVARIGAIGASAASFFPLSADKVVARDNSTMIIHKGWNFAIGNADDMAKMAGILNGLDGLIAGMYAKKTGKEKSSILQDMKDETWLVGWESIVDYGLADEVYESEEGPVDKPEAMAKMEAIKNKMRDSEMFKRDIERAAAWLPKQPKNKVNNSVVDGKNKTMEGNMNFKEFIDSNPQAKAEHEALVGSAVAEGKKEAIKAEAERVAGILDASNIVLADEIKTAIVEGQSVGEYAIAALKTAKTKPAADNAAALKGINAANEVSKDIPTKDHKAEVDEKSDAFVAALKKRKNKRR